ncbi:MAG: DUF2752 domain-containing protein [Acidimicrobiales bacterium]
MLEANARRRLGVVPPSLAPAVTAAGLVAAMTVVALRDPFQHHLSPPCPFHALTGLWCPFCGGTRAVWAAAHGQFGLMMHANALFPAMVLAAAWGWLSWLGKATGWWTWPSPNTRLVGWTFAGLLVAFTVLRNVPGLAFLAPPALA